MVIVHCHVWFPEGNSVTPRSVEIFEVSSTTNWNGHPTLSLLWCHWGFMACHFHGITYTWIYVYIYILYIYYIYIIYIYILYIYGGFLKWGYPQIIHFIRIFHYKLTVLGIHHLGKQPYIILRGSSWQAVSLLSQTAWDLETVTLHFWQWKLSCNVLFKCNVELYYIPVVPHKAVAEVSKIGNL